MTELDQNRLKWIEALESGKYKQAQYYLQRQGGFCCLGVACDIYDPKGWDVIPVNDVKQVKYKDLSSSPPEYINEYFGIIGKYRSDSEEADVELVDVLINMNDSYGKTFSEIAEYLRDIWELPK